mgnify:CR=1 FL=1
MAFKHHVEIALEWLRREEYNTAFSLESGILIPWNRVFLSDVAQSIIDYFMDDHFMDRAGLSYDDISLPGDAFRLHWYGIRLAFLTEAINELEDLLNVR